MPTIEVDQETFKKLERAAFQRNLTISAYVTPILENIVQERQPVVDRAEVFEDMLARANSRADRYPPGFKVDDSRETIYERRGE